MLCHTEIASSGKGQFSRNLIHKCSTVVVIPLGNLCLQLVSIEMVDFTNSYLLSRVLKPRSNCLPGEQTNREWKVLYES